MLRICSLIMILIVAGCDTPRHSESIQPEEKQLALPARPAGAPGGSEVARDVAGLPLAEREELIFDEISSGNIPSFNRQFVELEINGEIDGAPHTVRFNVLPEYLAVGSDSDHLLFPLSPITAQRIADLTDTTLPTPTLVDAVWSAADLKLAPAPIPPGPAMTTVPVFEDHNAHVAQQKSDQGATPDLLVAGHKKDVVLTGKLDTLSGRVAIYGWHRLDGSPIQPLYTGHSESWVDYSHGIRLLDRTVVVNDQPRTIMDVLSDSTLSRLVNNGTISKPRYATSFSTN